MFKKITYIVIAVVFIAGSILSYNAFAQKDSSNEELYKELELFSDAVSIIRATYVEDPKPKDLIYGALKGMLSSLDHYSQFMDPDMYNEMKIDTEGQFGGIGIEITIKDDLLTIITPIDDTPAYKVGLKAGDKIVKIEGELTKDLTLLDAVKKLRGQPGTDVNITVLREDTPKLLDFNITRSIIKLESIKKAEFIEPGIGYVRIAEFQEKTEKDLEKALNDMSKEGLKGFVLDLRNNPGGLLDSAVDVCAKFLEKGSVAVSIKGRIEKQNHVYKVDSGKHFTGFPIVVLINKGSASASEIVAGAMQDHKRGIVLGTKSFGKGSVQTVIPLSDGSAARLTTSKYFTPNGRSIHGEGIEPDIIVEFKERKKEGEEEKEDEAQNIFDELMDNKTEKDKKTEDLEKKYDNQIISAVDVLKGILIYSEKK